MRELYSAPLLVPLVTVRSFSTSVRTSRVTPNRGNHGDTPLDVVDAPPTAFQTARRNAVAERAKRAKRTHQQMHYNAYNHQLSLNIKRLDSWTAILALLDTELATTSYNWRTADRYVSPNKKWTQLTPQTLHAITAQLIRYRGTRHAASQYLGALSQFVRVLEMAAPRMYEGTPNGGRWRLLHHPYHYLRGTAQIWHKAAESASKQRRREEEQRKEEDDIRAQGGQTPRDIKRRIEEVRRKRREREAAGGVDDRRSGDSVVDAMQGLPTDEELRQLDEMSPEEKLRIQVQVLIDKQKEEKERKGKQAAEWEWGR